MSGPFPGAQAVSQFGDFLGACGEAAAKVLASVEGGGPATVAGVDSLVRNLQTAINPSTGRPYADTQGQTTLGGLQYGLQQQGIATQQTSFDSALQAVAQGQPAILEVAQGGNLPGHTDTNLQYHFVALVGSDSSGVYVADSDTAAGKSGQLIHESPAQLMAASPYGALVATSPASAGAPAFTVKDSVASGVGGLLQWPGQVVAAFANFNSLMAVFASGDFWARLGLILLGGLLLLIGVAVFVHPAEQRVENIGLRVAGVAGK